MKKIKDNFELFLIISIGCSLAVTGELIGFLMIGIAVGAYIYLKA